LPRIGLFAQVRKADVDLEELGRRLAGRQAELMALAERGELPPATPDTLIEA
jgi:hypothetical protein